MNPCGVNSTTIAQTGPHPAILRKIYRHPTMLTAVFRLTFTLIAAAVIGLTVWELRDRYFATSLVLTEAPMETAERLAQQGRWAEARWLAEFTRDHPALGDAERASRLSLAAESRLHSVRERAARFVSGAVTGEPEDLFGLMGSLSLDLFVIGDIRDIAVQGWKQMHYGTGDEILLALSATGLATTLVPHVDWAPAMLKALKRSGALSAELLRTLKVISRRALRSGDFRELSAMIEDVGDAALRLGPGPLRGAMPAVETAADLSKLVDAAKVNARDTYVLTSQFGTLGLRRLHAGGRNVSGLVGSIKIGARGVKAARKMTGTMSPAWLLLLLGVAISTLWWSLRPRRVRRARQVPRHQRIEPFLSAAAEPQMTHATDPALAPVLPPLIR